MLLYCVCVCVCINLLLLSYKTRVYFFDRQSYDMLLNDVLFAYVLHCYILWHMLAAKTQSYLKGQ